MNGIVGARSTCTLSVDVRASAAGSYVNTSGELTSSLGSSGTASATLAVAQAPVEISFTRIQQAVSEAVGTVALSLRIDGDLLEEEVAVVTLVSGDPTDLGGFVSETVRVGPTSPPELTVEIPVTNDGRPEADETFVFAISVPDDEGQLVAGSVTQTALVVVDDDAGNPVVQIPIRDADGDGVEDGGPRFFAVPLESISVGEVADAAGTDDVYRYLQGSGASLAAPSDLLQAGDLVLVDVAAGAPLALTGRLPSSDSLVFTGFDVAEGASAGRVLVPVGNPTAEPIRLDGVEVRGGTLADVALVFDPQAGAFRPVSLPEAMARVLSPFEAVILQVDPDGEVADVSVTVPLDGSASGTGDAIGDAPFVPLDGETSVVVTLTPRDGTGDRLALRFLDAAEPGLDPLDGLDLLSPLGPTLAASYPTTLGASPLPFAALALDPPGVGTPVTIPLVVGVAEVGTYEISYEVVAGSRPVTVDLLDRGAPTRLAEGGTYSFPASPADAAALAARFALRLTFSAGVATETSPGAPVVSIFPNPAAGEAAVRLSDAPAGRVRVALYDALGRQAAVLHDGPVAGGDLLARIEAGRLTPGVYVVRVDGEGLSESRRLTVVR